METGAGRCPSRARVTSGAVLLGGVKAALRWEGTSFALKNAAWTLGDAGGTGTLAVSLAGSSPAFTLEGALHDLPWSEGTLDIDGRLSARGMDIGALANATAE